MQCVLDHDIDMVLRIHAPDLDKFKNWTPL